MKTNHTHIAIFYFFCTQKKRNIIISRCVFCLSFILEETHQKEHRIYYFRSEIRKRVTISGLYFRV